MLTKIKEKMWLDIEKIDAVFPNAKVDCGHFVKIGDHFIEVTEQEVQQIDFEIKKLLGYLD